ncbi:MAG: hypothetical protein K2K29_06560, partial [Muribaculaceae bacterium]|nr:hypothetical protein [Muribaculaceae bacterium]
IYTSSEVLEESGFSPRRPVAKEEKKETEELSVGERMLMYPDSEPQGRIRNISDLSNLEEVLENENPFDEDSDKEILDFLSNYSDKEIEQEISKFASEEKYEIAARLKSLLKKRNQRE